jgi:hypothetical protein
MYWMYPTYASITQQVSRVTRLIDVDRLHVLDSVFRDQTAIGAVAPEFSFQTFEGDDRAVIILNNEIECKPTVASWLGQNVRLARE